ncbi:hypothetical protein FH972_012459 [Carpinus fangiana]|uniref:Helicase/UvrB N-terminal domain-containing protein n=1 Tax=Carpinus fangiana TaxID=176857 RepID=A0A5N6R4P8_9ROSI|nr:hypothetical protein FH972_012459 [Carpinus fangiana]
MVQREVEKPWNQSLLKQAVPSNYMYVDPLPFARSYQLEALEMAMKQSTIVFLETRSGKTLVAIMLLRSYAYLLRKPSPFIAVS